MLLCTTLVETRPATAAAGRTYTNAVKSRKGADPWLEYDNRNYCLVATSWSSEITLRKSPTPAGLSTRSPSVRHSPGRRARPQPSYTLVNRTSGKSLDLENGSPANGANVRRRNCNGAAAQKWRIEDQGDDTSRLLNVASGKALDVADRSAADGADIRQWSWLNNACRQWQLKAN
ncbi:RICIN domain-containing protein [Streptomyces sp. G-G2]|uniref:RICIN domain-containing protein n=1 Tax=Streptomyces sp. G-G2 TaxID=3046201 RepID=UPI0032D9A442